MTSFSPRVIFVAINLVLSTLACQSSEASTSSDQGYLVRRTNDIGIPYTMYLFPRGLRVDNKDYTIIVRPPFTNIAIYRLRNKTCIDMPINRGATLFGAKYGHADKFDVHKDKEGGKKIVGFDTTEYTVKSLDQNGKVTRVRKLWAMPIKGMPKELLDDYARLVNLPPGVGFPLRMTTRSERRQKANIIIVDTLELKRMNFNPSIIKGLPGYKRVATEIQLLTTGEHNDAMDLFSQPQAE